MTEYYMRRLLGSVALAFFVLAGAGCNTIEGAGKDVEAAGEAIEEEAEEAK